MGLKEIIGKNPKKLFWINLFTNLSALSSVITMFYLHRGLNLYEISVLGAVVSWAIILLEVPTGMFSDIAGRKKTVIMGVISLIIYSLIYIFAHSFLIFVIGSIFFALATSLFSGCVTSIIYDSLKKINEEHKAKEHIAKYRSASILGAIIVPPIASVIAKNLLEYQFIILLLISLIGYVIALSISFSLYEIKSKNENKVKHFIFLKDSYTDILKNKSLLKMILNQGIGFVCLLVFLSILWQPYFKEQGIPISIFGAVFSVSNILIFLIFRNMSKIEKLVGIKKFIFLSSFIPGIVFIILAIYPNYIIAIVGFFIIHILISIRDPPLVHYKNRHIESSRRATTLSIISMIYSLIAVIAQPILGAIANKNIQNAFIVLGIVLILSPIIFRINKNDTYKKQDKSYLINSSGRVSSLVPS